MFVKTVLCLFLCVSYVSASCVSNIDINFDFKSSSIHVESDVLSVNEILDIRFDGFELIKKSKFEIGLNNTSHKTKFSYTKYIKNLNKDFIYLLSDWYPSIQNRCVYIVSTNLDETYKVVHENISNDQPSISFVASPNFITNKISYNNITIETYFLNDNEALSQKYLDQSIKFIKLFEKRIGKYPFDTFKIVENIYQTGYSLPGYTLIGSRLLSKDYVLNQSLAHEILHQYFGSAISSIDTEGNWLEGITTYLADDYLKKLNKDDVLNRKTLLSQFQTHVSPKEDFPISNFSHRVDKQSMLIGYSKFSHVLYMLENKLGSKNFQKLIAAFYLTNNNKNISLSQFVEFFDENTGMDLKRFFEQWFYQKGIIDFKVKNIKSYYDKSGFWLSFDLTQKKNQFYEFELPLGIQTYDKLVQKVVSITKSKQNVRMKFDSEVLSFTLDENYEVFRTLSQEERLLNISLLLRDKNLIAVVNKEDEERYRNIQSILPFAKLITNNELKYMDLKKSSVLFLDLNNKLLKQFYPNINKNKQSTSVAIKPHIYNDKKVMAVLHLGSAGFKSLKHLQYYSKYNQVLFDKDKTMKTSPYSQNGIAFQVNHKATSRIIQAKQGIQSLYGQIKDKRIVYVSESHDEFNHHLNQLRVIKTLHKKNKKLVIAMEMFQKPFQKELDLYIEGKSSLDDFLKNTQYFDRWKFEYNLYKPIIDYAKKHKIKLLAINIDRAITSKISRQGLFSLNNEEKKLLPKSIDQSNFTYQKGLNEIFTRHLPVKKSKGTSRSPHQLNLDFFYQSQLIWDEKMAENISEYLIDNKDVTMVVLAGSGHLQNHDGIPSRVFRRNSLPYAVLLNEVPTSKAGDILLNNPSKSTMNSAKKLGVFLRSGSTLIVDSIKKPSLAYKIGLQKDDVILELNRQKVKTLANLKRVLYLMDDASSITIKVLRKNKKVELILK